MHSVKPEQLTYHRIMKNMEDRDGTAGEIAGCKLRDYSHTGRSHFTSGICSDKCHPN
jgi:hypothetical protein